MDFSRPKSVGKSFLYFCFFGVALAAQAEILEFQVSASQKKLIPLKEVCASIGRGDLPLIEAKGSQEIDCMGKSVKTTPFCEKAGDKDNFMRAFIDKDKKNLVCQSGERVMLSYHCTDTESSLCRSSLVGCEDMQKILAKNLGLYQHSLNKSAKDKKQILRCIFLSKKQLNVGTVDL